MTSANVFPTAGPPLILYLVLCYLVQQPKTQRIRLLLLPVVVPWLWYITFWVQWAPPRTMAINVPFSKCPTFIHWSRLTHFVATTGVLFVLRALEYCLSTNGPRKVIAMQPENVNSEKYKERSFTSFDKGLSATNELFQSHRGIGWDFGTGAGLRLPPVQAKRAAHDRRKWIKLTLWRGVVLNYLVVDVINTWWRTIPEISGPTNLDKHFANLDWPLRAAVPSSVFLVVAAYMSMWYNAVAIIDVAVFGVLPASWPVLFGQPVRTPSGVPLLPSNVSLSGNHSLYILFGPSNGTRCVLFGNRRRMIDRSHTGFQLSRHTFLWPLGYLLGAVFGTSGVAFGAFLASGLYHKYALSSLRCPFY